MIVVDASALVAIADGEPEGAAFTALIAASDGAVINVVNAVETGLILIGRRLVQDTRELNLWLAGLAIRIDSSSVTLDAALVAYLTYGRNYHAAGLNLGDAFAYALAKSLEAPLLYKGDDFARTDITPAYQPT
jgi:ribonuclease VapC